MSDTAIKGGLAAEEWLERTSGGIEHVALMLTELGSSVEAARYEWKYDTSPLALELVRLCTKLDRFLNGLSITSDGELTWYRECSRCSGEGKTSGEDPCIDCGGRGAVMAESVLDGGS